MTFRAFNLPDGIPSACDRLEHDGIVSRIWAHDHTVWGPSQDEITNRLGWLHVPETMHQQLPGIELFVDEVRRAGFDHVVLLGMGGSSLAPTVFRAAFAAPLEGLRLTVVDTTHPTAVRDITSGLDLPRTLFLVATKSGTTTETLSLFRHFYNQVHTAGLENPGNAFVAITDPGSPLAHLATERRFRRTFLNDPNIGGRYAALSLFGLIPAALLGIDVRRLLEAADAFVRAEARETSTETNTAASLGVVLGELAKAGRDKVTFFLSEPIASFSAWVEQLIAESTGKDGTGILPVAGERPGVPNGYGQDRVFVHLRLGGDSSLDARVDALEADGRPVIRIDLDDVYDLGREFFRWEFATAVACHLLGVNPFDQPNVESAKQLARAKLQAISATGKTRAVSKSPLTAQAAAAFLAIADSTDYIAVQAYLPPSDDLAAALADLQAALRDRFRLATTVGYGPRFLHSTGQLHKGDRGNGHFIQLVSASMPELPIPDAAGESASSVSFGSLIAAQAEGDREALQVAGRHVLTLSVEEESAAEVRRVVRGL